MKLRFCPCSFVAFLSVLPLGSSRRLKSSNKNDDVMGALTSCPEIMPAMDSMMECDSTALSGECLYDQLTCEGHGELVFGYEHTCTCFNSTADLDLDVDTFICAPVSNGDCPSISSVSDDDDKDTLTTCPDFMPSVPSVRVCDASELREDCVYGPVTCEGHANLVYGYEHMCTCFNNTGANASDTFECAAVNILCPPPSQPTNDDSSQTNANGDDDILTTCPGTMPSFDVTLECDSTQLSRDCLYDQVKCEGHGELIFGYKHTCTCFNATEDPMVDMDTFQCAPTTVNCPPTPETNANTTINDVLTSCPGVLPDLGKPKRDCDAYELTEDCVYGPVTCEGHGDLVFGYEHHCTCFNTTNPDTNRTGTLDCAVVTTRCPETISSEGIGDDSIMEDDNFVEEDDAFLEDGGDDDDFVDEDDFFEDKGSPNNLAVCPMFKPEIRTICDAGEITEDCHYSRINCEGYDEPQGYSHLCTCHTTQMEEDDIFLCADVQFMCPNPPLTSDAVPAVAATNPPNLIPIGIINPVTPATPKPVTTPTVTGGATPQTNPPNLIPIGIITPATPKPVTTPTVTGGATPQTNPPNLIPIGIITPDTPTRKPATTPTVTGATPQTNPPNLIPIGIITPDTPTRKPATTPTVTGATPQTNPPNLIPIGIIIPDTPTRKPAAPTDTSTLAEASPDNHEACPAVEPDPGLGLRCDTTSLTEDKDCKYNPYVCPGYEEFVGYIARCTCFDEGDATGVLRCAQALVECPEPPENGNENGGDYTPPSTCPQDKPNDADACSLQGLISSCRYTPTSCPESEVINFADNCICAAGLFTCVAQVDVECHNAITPQCPISNPDGQSEECSIDESITCGYNPAGCPESSDPGVFLTKCQCKNGEFECSTSLSLDCLSYDVNIDEGEELSPFNLCFPGNAIVEVQGRGPIAMEALKIGDMVQVAAKGDNKQREYEPVYSFGHKAHNRVGNFLQLHTKDPSATLRISADHLVQEKTRGFVPASSINIGDQLVHVHENNHGDSLVTDIRLIKARGMYAPFTPSGVIVVDNTIASSFVDVRPKLSSVVLRNVSPQWIAHTGELPHRIACHYLKNSCLEEESYDKNGVNYLWGTIPLQMMNFVSQINSVVVQVLIMVAAALLLVSFWMAEQIALMIMTSSSVFVIVILAAAAAIMRRNKAKVANE